MRANNMRANTYEKFFELTLASFDKKIQTYQTVLPNDTLNIKNIMYFNLLDILNLDALTASLVLAKAFQNKYT